MPNVENLGPAERIINSLLTYTDHLFHGRPGIVTPDTTLATGAKWQFATYVENAGVKTVYALREKGPVTKVEIAEGKSLKIKGTAFGVLDADGTTIKDPRGRKIGEYRSPGIFKEVATWMFRQVAEIWKLDNEFAARWASHAYAEDHRDLKVILASFMLVQTRKGDPVLDGGKVAFLDEDYRDVGEAMILQNGAKYLDLKMILRILGVLELPEVAAIVRELGFGNSARSKFLGRFPKVAEKWLRYREENPQLLKGLIKSGQRSSLKRLATTVRYKPTTPKFFKDLRWKQVQAKDGHRGLAIGEAVSAAETWADLREEQICERIVQSKMNFKRIVGLLPEAVGLSRAVMAAAIEAGSLSDKDLILYTPTLEELGLLKVPAIHGKWQLALKAAEDQRAANVATRVKGKETKELLQGAADTAMQKAVEEVIRGMRVYFIVDISGSMENAIEQAKVNITKFLPGFPLDKIHASIFNTSGREVILRHATAAGVENAFQGIRASGGTSYGAGVMALSKHKPKDDEDALFFFIGDEEAAPFAHEVRLSGINPVAFAFIKVRVNGYSAVRDTAQALGIPCIMVDQNTFEDPYAIPRTIRNLIAATPVGRAPARIQQRETLVDVILKTPLLTKPAWAA
jgi:hypothetical protein